MSQKRLDKSTLLNKDRGCWTRKEDFRGFSRVQLKTGPGGIKYYLMKQRRKGGLFVDPTDYEAGHSSFEAAIENLSR